MTVYRSVYRSVYRPVYRSVLAGGAASFSIADLDPYAWWDHASVMLNGSGTTALNGERVDDWVSAYGTGKIASQAGDGNRPSLVTNGLNGLPALRFDGLSVDYMRCTFGETLSQPNTIVMVSNATGATNVMCDGNDVSNRHAIYRGSGKYNILAGSNVAGTTAIDSNPHIFVAVFNGASSKLYLDGALEAQGDAGALPITGITIAATYVPNAYTSGDFSTFGVLDRAIGDDELTPLHELLAATYGLTLNV